MGLKFKNIVQGKEIELKDLRGKILAVDSMNILYQFITTIRGPDGSPLTNSSGKITSHLIGLFSRTTSLMEKGLKLVFVFDGKAPEIKRKTQEQRASIKKTAALKFNEAKELGNVVDMKKFASRTARLTSEMISDAKSLLVALGLPVVQAPSEGEAQAAFMVKMGDAYAAVSQDYDNLIFDCPRLIRNLSISGKRKKIGTLGFQIIKPEIILRDDVLAKNSLTLDQLIVAAILAGTDYNPGGIKGIGPKKSLKLLHEHGNEFDTIFQTVEWDKHYPNLSWKTIFDTIKNIPVTEDFTLEWKRVDEGAVKKLLIDEYGFGAERVENKLEKLRKQQSALTQKGLSSFF